VAALLSDRVVADRMWRDPATRADFEHETKLTDSHSGDYHVRFREWAKDRLRYADFLKELEVVINKHRMEKDGGNTPDFLLAEYLTNCLKIFDGIVKKRDAWYGRDVVTTLDAGEATPALVHDSDFCPVGQDDVHNEEGA
jgi:hypothetical protein